MKCDACKIKMDYVENVGAFCHFECGKCHSIGTTNDPDDFPRVRPKEPLRRAFTQAEIVSEVVRWAKKNYLGSNDYHKTLGILFDFVTDIVPKEEETK